MSINNKGILYSDTWQKSFVALLSDKFGVMVYMSAIQYSTGVMYSNVSNVREIVLRQMYGNLVMIY